MSTKIPSQNEPFTVQGHWWLPARQEKVAGELRYTEDNLVLSLYGGLNEAVIDSPFSATPEVTELPLIHGESLDGELLTVLRAYYTHWKPDINSLSFRPGQTVALRSSELHCHWLLRGMHCSSPTERFAKCGLHIPNLEEWLGEVPFAVRHGEQFQTVQLEYARPMERVFEISVKNSLLRFVHTVQPPGLPLGTSPTIKHRTYAELEIGEPISAEQFAEQASEIVGLFSFLYGGPLLSRKVTLTHPDDSDEAPSLYYPRHSLATRTYERRDFAIRFEQIRDTFGDILANWLGASETLLRARRMVLSSERKPSSFIELRFLPLVHAAEVLSNGSAVAKIVSETKYRELKRQMLGALPDNVPDELKESIKSSLGHANSRFLKRRLLGMLGEFDDETCALFCTDKATFIKGVVDTRNHFTHYSTEVGSRILQGVELHWATHKLSLMLRVLLLAKAGVPQNVLRDAIHSHLELRQKRIVWKKLTEEGSVYEGVPELS